MLDELRASRFSELKGASLAASIPVPERLLTEIVGMAVPAGGPVRDLRVALRGGNRIELSVKLARFGFLPPVPVLLEIEQQPEPPDWRLVLRVSSLPGVVTLAGAVSSIGTRLPAGLTLEDHRLIVDLRMLLERSGYGEVTGYIEKLRVVSEEGRLVLEVNVRV
jgi:hypothetical protein